MVTCTGSTGMLVQRRRNMVPPHLTSVVDEDAADGGIALEPPLRKVDNGMGA